MNQTAQEDATNGIILLNRVVRAFSLFTSTCIHLLSLPSLSLSSASYCFYCGGSHCSLESRTHLHFFCRFQHHQLLIPRLCRLIIIHPLFTCNLSLLLCSLHCRNHFATLNNHNLCRTKPLNASRPRSYNHNAFLQPIPGRPGLHNPQRHPRYEHNRSCGCRRC